MKEQIEEMAKIIAKRSKAFRNPNVAFMTTATKTAESLYNAGYRKVIHCKDCAYRDTEGCPNTYWNGGELESNVEDDSFCSGAKMKGGAE